MVSGVCRSVTLRRSISDTSSRSWSRGDGGGLILIHFQWMVEGGRERGREGGRKGGREGGRDKDNYTPNVLGKLLYRSRGSVVELIY